MNFIKMGTNCFIECNEMNLSKLKKKAREIESLENSVVVMSGAIKLGKIEEGDNRPNKDLTSYELQGYASVGQRIMMDYCKVAFKREVAQMLVTMHDLEYRNHIKDLIHENLRKERMTIINYNDCVDFKELKMDNDTLASKLAVYCHSERLIVLGNYDGFFNKSGVLIYIARSVTPSMYSWCDGKSNDGTGGFKPKLDAAKRILDANSEMIIGNLKYKISDLISEDIDMPRTVFSKKSNMWKEFEDRVLDKSKLAYLAKSFREC